MRSFLLLLMSTLALEVQAQEVKMVIKDHESPPYREIYHVLKSNKKIREGKYIMKVSNITFETGYYKNNQKDSTWIEFFPGTKEINTIGKYKNDRRTGSWKEYAVTNEKAYLSEVGNYSEGKRTGKWHTLAPWGDTVRTLDYNVNQVTYRNPQIRENMNFDVILPEGTVRKSLQTAPLLIDKTDGQAINLKRTLKIKYPAEAGQSAITGQVVISYIVDENGNETNHKAESEIGFGCEEEIIRVLKLYPGKWIPGTYQGKPISTKHEFKFTFNIRETNRNNYGRY
ncbi:energy transducer TonB [Adhaeribacter sp. BT258]|uniref:Energy transducer TonB n=1 Tax=Adhaeribacter terrigena TaxID=2793070 RepID=A0ABS1C7Q4_9BACT|nr:energy transducer TonB [Adhaeribacter terrigena]MBK0404615.1 energy transducer TonB [Adhaeribacter terrigena]